MIDTRVKKLNQIISLRTLHPNIIKLDHFFVAIALQLLSYFAKFQYFKEFR